MSRVVLVTGSSRGIGRAIALRAAAESFDVVVHCRSRNEEAEQVAAQIRQLGRSARILQFDVTDRDASRESLLADIEAHGSYYGIVCNAGLHRDAVFPAMDADTWDSVVHGNLDAFYNVVHPLVMPMIRRHAPGRIVTIASIAGLVGNYGQVNYSAAKAGVIGATKALAVELAKRQITVNCVAPGWIQTELLGDMPHEDLLRSIPAQRIGAPEDVAAAVSFLLSDGASYITRQVIAVNGGLF